MKVFTGIPADAPLMVIEAVWQYSHHVLAGLISHKGPILTFANWSGQWPGLVGMLNLNASLSKAGVKYSTLWSENFTDEFALSGLKCWLETGEVKHDLSHVHALDGMALPAAAAQAAREVTSRLRREKAIMGVFDEGCMGMYNAIIPDELLNPLGVYKERLSQSALYAAMRASMTPKRRRFATGSTQKASISTSARTKPRSSPRRRFCCSARCTSPLCALPTNSAAIQSAFNTSRD